MTTVTKEPGKFGPLWIVTAGAVSRTFFRAQDAADWLDDYHPGVTSEWRDSTVTAEQMETVIAFMSEEPDR